MGVYRLFLDSYVSSCHSDNASYLLTLLLVEALSYRRLVVVMRSGLGDALPCGCYVRK